MESNIIHLSVNSMKIRMTRHELPLMDFMHWIAAFEAGDVVRYDKHIKGYKPFEMKESFEDMLCKHLHQEKETLRNYLEENYQRISPNILQFLAQFNDCIVVIRRDASN